jgi:L-threonylcarbamoyladenylate synthase
MVTDGAIQAVVAAIEAGRPALLPTDTVYGLVTTASRDEATLGVYALKGRAETQPTALLASSVEELLAAIPELDGAAEVAVRTLLPGPYTLILPNPARRYRWLAGTRVDAIGVRVAHLPAPAQRVLDAVRTIMATSANDPGGPSPASLDDVPDRIRRACAAELDLGPLPGTPSTVIDFTAPEPYVIRDGAAPAAEAIARVRAALAA